MCFFLSVGSLLNTEGVNKEPYASEDLPNEESDLVCCSSSLAVKHQKRVKP